MDSKITTKKKLFLIADVFMIIALTALDQFTKYLAVLHLENKPPVILIDGVLEFMFLKNNGAAFGMLQNQKVFFVIIATAIILLIAYVLYKMPEDKKYVIMHVLLVLVAAGAAGNLIDRVRHDYVVDFIYFVIINFPIFNVAVIYVTVSTFVLVLLFLFYYKESDFGFLKKS